MKHEIDLSKYSIRTDLIIENQNQFSDQENYQHDNIKVTSVKLSNEEASKINKKYTSSTNSKKEEYAKLHERISRKVMFK